MSEQQFGSRFDPKKFSNDAADSSLGLNKDSENKLVYDNIRVKLVVLRFTEPMKKLRKEENGS